MKVVMDWGDGYRGKPTSTVVPALCRELLIQPTDFYTPSDVSLVPRLRGDDGSGEPTSIVVPAMRRELLIQPTDFPTPSDVSLVPRLRGDDDKKETGMTVRRKRG